MTTVCGHDELKHSSFVTPVNLHGFNQDHRRLQIEFEFRRIYGHDTFGGREPQGAVFGANGRRLRTACALTRWQSVGLHKGPAGKRIGLSGGKIVQHVFLNPHQAHVGAEPQIAHPIFEQVTNEIAGQAIVSRILGPFSVLKPRQPVPARADPQNAVQIRVEAGNVVARQAFFRHLNGNKFPILETIQALVSGPDPKVSIGGFGDGTDDIARQAVGGRETFPFLAIPARQAVLCARPQLAGPILK